MGGVFSSQQGTRKRRHEVSDEWSSLSSEDDARKYAKRSRKHAAAEALRAEKAARRAEEATVELEKERERMKHTVELSKMQLQLEAERAKVDFLVHQRTSSTVPASVNFPNPCSISVPPWHTHQPCPHHYCHSPNNIRYSEPQESRHSHQQYQHPNNVRESEPQESRCSHQQYHHPNNVRESESQESRQSHQQYQPPNNVRESEPQESQRSHHPRPQVTARDTDGGRRGSPQLIAHSSSVVHRPLASVPGEQARVERRRVFRPHGSSSLAPLPPMPSRPSVPSEAHITGTAPAPAPAASTPSAHVSNGGTAANNSASPVSAVTNVGITVRPATNSPARKIRVSSTFAKNGERVMQEPFRLASTTLSEIEFRCNDSIVEYWNAAKSAIKQRLDEILPSVSADQKQAAIARIDVSQVKLTFTNGDTLNITAQTTMSQLKKLSYVKTGRSRNPRVVYVDILDMPVAQDYAASSDSSANSTEAESSSDGDPSEDEDDHGYGSTSASEHSLDVDDEVSVAGSATIGHQNRQVHLAYVPGPGEEFDNPAAIAADFRPYVIHRGRRLDETQEGCCSLPGNTGTVLGVDLEQCLERMYLDQNRVTMTGCAVDMFHAVQNLPTNCGCFRWEVGTNHPVQAFRPHPNRFLFQVRDVNQDFLHDTYHDLRRVAFSELPFVQFRIMQSGGGASAPLLPTDGQGSGVQRSALTRFFSLLKSDSIPAQQRPFILVGRRYVFNASLPDVVICVILKALLLSFLTCTPLPNFIHQSLWNYILFGKYPTEADVRDLLGTQAPQRSPNTLQAMTAEQLGQWHEHQQLLLADGAPLPGNLNDSFTFTAPITAEQLDAYFGGCMLNSTVRKLRAWFVALVKPHTFRPGFNWDSLDDARFVSSHLGDVIIGEHITIVDGGEPETRLRFCQLLRSWFRRGLSDESCCEDVERFLWWATGTYGYPSKIIHVHLLCDKRWANVAPSHEGLPPGRRVEPADRFRNGDGSIVEESELQAWQESPLIPLPTKEQERIEEYTVGDIMDWAPKAHTCESTIHWPYRGDPRQFCAFLRTALNTISAGENFDQR